MMQIAGQCRYLDHAASLLTKLPPILGSAQWRAIEMPSLELNSICSHPMNVISKFQLKMPGGIDDMLHEFYGGIVGKKPRKSAKLEMA
jgi:hypothetical protein